MKAETIQADSVEVVDHENLLHIPMMRYESGRWCQVPDLVDWHKDDDERSIDPPEAFSLKWARAVVDSFIGSYGSDRVQRIVIIRATVPKP